MTEQTELAESVNKLSKDFGLSIVVPVFNERDNVGPLAEELLPILEKTGRGYEIIFVDDASTDGSLDVLRELAGKHPHVRVLSFERNCGQTPAFDAGFKAAVNDVIITMDGDLQNDPHDIPRLLEKIEDHHLVVGWRWQRHDTLVRRLSSSIANSFRRRKLNDSYHDVGCSLKAFRRDALQRIRLFNHMHRFFPILFDIEGFKVCEVKVNHRERVHGKPKYGIRNRMMQGVRSVRYVRYMQDNKLGYRIKEEF